MKVSAEAEIHKCIQRHMPFSPKGKTEPQWASFDRGSYNHRNIDVTSDELIRLTISCSDNTFLNKPAAQEQSTKIAKQVWVIILTLNNF